MNENKHTPEPWPVFTDIATIITPDPNGTPVAILSWDDYIRARACVNACAGIPTETIEAVSTDRQFWPLDLKGSSRKGLITLLGIQNFTVQGLKKQADSETRKKLKNQRDELLETLKKAADSFWKLDNADIHAQEAEAAIASVKGACVQQSVKNETQACLTRTDETQALKDVIAERRRQVEAEGWTPEHDDAHGAGELAIAAACYAGNSAGKWGIATAAWPWAPKWWKPANARRDLVKAGALILAEIERQDRAKALTGPVDHANNAENGADQVQSSGDVVHVDGDFVQGCASSSGLDEQTISPATSDACSGIPALVFYPAGSLGEEVQP